MHLPFYDDRRWHSSSITILPPLLQVKWEAERRFTAVFSGPDFKPLDGAAPIAMNEPHEKPLTGGTMTSQLAVAPSDAVDFAEHLQTYHLFVNGMKYGAITVALILVVLAVVTL